MVATNNDAADDGTAGDVRCQRWSSPIIGLRTMGPRTIGPRMMGIANTFVVDDGVANNWAADDARR